MSLSIRPTTPSRLFFLWLCCLIGWLALLPAPIGAQAQIRLGAAHAGSATFATEQVRAELVVLAAQGIAPGQALTLGLRLEHQPGWHTYWKNAGDSGLPTELQWQLPAGMQAGDIAWPLPQALRVGDWLNYGYEGTVLLPVPVTVGADFVPDADGMVDIRLHAQWLVCRVECIPQEGTLHLRVPAGGSHTLLATEFETAAIRQPQDTHQANALLTVQSADEYAVLRVSQLPAAVHGQALAFFPEDAQIFQHAAILAQADAQSWNGDTWTARLPLSALRGETPSRLHFVLAVADTDTDAKQAWRMTAPVQGQWPVVNMAEISPALAAALQANQSEQTTEISAATTTAPDKSGWMAALLGGLIGGMLLNLMPCVFPVLAIKLLGLTRHGTDVHIQRMGGLLYAVGVVLSFVALGATLLALRAAGEQLGWGFQLQNPLMVAALAALFTLLGLNLAGVFEFGQMLPGRWANLHAKHPLGDALLSGVLAVAVASPCTAPFMGASLGFAVALPMLQALTVFVALGMGMALPYVLVSWVPALIRWLPKSGPWMATFRHAMAFPMLATVVWLTWVLGQQTGIDGVAALLALLLCLSALVWVLTLGGMTRIVFGVLVLIIGGWLVHGMGRYLLEPAPDTNAVASTTPDARWQIWSLETQQTLLAQGRAVFVDYTAAWCVTCQYNKRTTLADAQVLQAFAQRNVALLRADWTRRDTAITTELAQLGRSGVPVYVLHVPGQTPHLLSEMPSVDEVLAQIARLPAPAKIDR